MSTQSGLVHVHTEWVSACPQRVGYCMSTQSGLLPVHTEWVTACPHRVGYCLSTQSGLLHVHTEWVNACLHIFFSLKGMMWRLSLSCPWIDCKCWRWSVGTGKDQSASPSTCPMRKLSSFCATPLAQKSSCLARTSAITLSTGME